MSRKGTKSMSKRDFDDQFEAFLKESMSSEDSVNSARINKFLEPPTKRESRPWWDNDDDDDNKGSSRSFMKKSTGGSAPEKKSASSGDGKTAPKPKARKDVKLRSKAESSISRDSLDDISEKSEEDHHDFRSHNNSLDDFPAFIGEGRTPGVPLDIIPRPPSSGPRVHLPEDSQDSIDTEELLNNRTGHRLGMDTLDEMADKEKFFRDLEKNADGTVDYRQLNQEMSATGNTLSPEGAARTAATLAALQDIEDEEEDDVGPRPVTRGDNLLSEKDYSEQKPSMLSKVSLMDSLESTMNTTTSPHIGKGTLRDAKDMLEEQDEDDYEYPGSNYRPGTDMLKSATGFLGTNTSQEIEALHKALEKVGLSATIGNDSQLEFSSQTGDKDTDELVKKLLNTGSGKQRNVADIMRELEELQNKVGTGQTAANQRSASPKSPRSSLERQENVEEDMDEIRGFDLSPARPITEQDFSHRGDYSQNGNFSNRGDYSQNDNYSQRGDNSQRGGDSSNKGGDSSYRGGFDTSHTEDTEMYRPVIEVSVRERSRVKKKEQKKEERKKNAEKDNIHSKERKKNNNSSLQRSRSSSPLKIDYSETLKWKHKAIKGSGYGQPNSPTKPSRDKNRDRDILGYSRSTLGTEGKLETSVSPAKPPIKPGLTGTVDVSPRKKEGKKESAEKMWSPAEVSKQRVKGSQSSRQARLGTVASTQLDASVESFAKYIKEHFAGKTVAVPEVKYSEDEPAVSASFKEKEQLTDTDSEQIIAALKAELEAEQHSFERQLETVKLEYEQQLAELRQENFVLKAKVSGEDESEVKRKVLAGESLEGVSKDQLDSLKRELKEQETLISGYQQENKRLYDEMKNIRKQTKQAEERMFNENQKLLAETANLRAQLEKLEVEYQNKGLITGPGAQQKLAAGDAQGAITHLENELSQAKRTSDALSREMAVLQHSRVELEKHVERLVMEREQLNKTIDQSKTLKSEEATALERKYQGEAEKLQKKLKWYAENQELLDKGAKKVKTRDEEIHKLKMRIEELQTESGKRVEDSKVRARERGADNKKIQDLQRQVKEMEAILKRRNPNSLPSLMIAAAAAGENNNAGNNRTAYTEVLETRVNKLEKELEGKDAETDQLLRGVEQKYHSVKLQFEERIKELELQLSIYQGQADHMHPHTHSLALERELESVRERYKLQVKDLQTEVDRLSTELNKNKKTAEASSKAELQPVKESEIELRAQLKTIQLEVETKNHDLQVMQKSLERLRKEKQLSYTTVIGKRGQSKSRGGNQKDDLTEAEFVSLPAQSANQKEYEPKTFEDAHISDVLKENEDLKMKMDRMCLQLDQYRVDLRKVVAENEAVLRQTSEMYEERLEQARTSHQQDVKRLLAQQALDHSTSRMAELQSKVDTQEVMIKHLREQQARLEVEAEAASVLRIKQTRLEESLKSLHSELKEAKKSHTPEMRHFEALQEKIIQIENKHALREKELQDIIRNSRQAASVETEREVNKWRQLVETKNNEIQRFRVELDSILEVLRVLQKQGVVIPVASTAVS